MPRLRSRPQPHLRSARKEAFLALAVGAAVGVGALVMLMLGLV